MAGLPLPTLCRPLALGGLRLGLGLKLGSGYVWSRVGLGTAHTHTSFCADLHIHSLIYTWSPIRNRSLVVNSRANLKHILATHTGRARIRTVTTYNSTTATTLCFVLAFCYYCTFRPPAPSPSGVKCRERYYYCCTTVIRLRLVKRTNTPLIP